MVVSRNNAEKKQAAAALRAAVEARTGAKQNMQQFGFEPMKYDGGGNPTRFCKPNKRSILNGVAGWAIQRTRQKTWRIIRYPGRLIPVGGSRGCANIPVEHRCVTAPQFTGPIAAAIWLQVEISNGNGNSI